MLYAVGLGPGDKKLLTLRAVEVIKKVDEVIVPGKMAHGLIKDIKDSRIVEFPMGSGESVAKDLAKEIVEKRHDVAFCCLGDPMIYSTFHHLYREIAKIDPDYDVEVIPGITSASSALARGKIFVESGMLITTPEFEKPDVVVVMKAKKPKEIERKLRSNGFRDFWFFERLFMEGEKTGKDLPEKADYFSMVVAKI
uniref:Precorrin-2 methylase n=1 Tax=Archaeoglobus fulgidus TaxID=2234 RepID=A0A7J2THH6_ARCFL